MEHITGTLYAYYHICPRKAWLFAGGIEMEHGSDLVAEGRLIGEHSYPGRAERYREVQIAGIRLDFFDAETGTVHEIKKSDKLEPAHIAQLKYYLWVLEQHGIPAQRGILEYPKLRQRQEVALSSEDRKQIPETLAALRALTAAAQCPPRLPKSRCTHCAYLDFCWASEPGGADE